MDNATNKDSDRDNSSNLDVEGIDIIDNNQSKVIDNPEKTGEIRNPDGTFKKGVSGNLKGKQKGTISVISRLKEMFKEDPEDFENFVKEYKRDPMNRKHIVEMIDGKPKQTLAGDKENPLRIITVDKELAEIYEITPDTTDNSEGQDTI